MQRERRGRRIGKREERCEEKGQKSRWMGRDRLGRRMGGHD